MMLLTISGLSNTICQLKEVKSISSLGEDKRYENFELNDAWSFVFHITHGIQRWKTKIDNNMIVPL